MCLFHNRTERLPLIQPTHTADKWTLISCYSNFLIGFLTNIITLGAMFNDVSGIKPVIWNLSPYGLTFGIVIGLFASVGDAYTEKAVNTVHQAQDHNKNIQLNADSTIKLDLKENLFLLATAIDLTTEKAAGLLLIPTYIFNNKMSRLLSVCCDSAFLFAGYLSAKAEIRTRKNNLHKLKQLRSSSLRSVVIN